MDRQILITLGREFGSGGHKIAQGMAQQLGINYYDRNILEHMFADNPAMAEQMEKYDEKLAKPFLTRHVRGYSSSIEEHLAELQFDFIRKKAEDGESFIIVGRCGEFVLRDYEQLISFFILGDRADKIARVEARCQLNEKDAIAKMERHDRTRKKYHNKYSDMKWGDSRGYDLCVNVSRLGIEGTTNLLLDFVEQRMKRVEDKIPTTLF